MWCISLHLTFHSLSQPGRKEHKNIRRGSRSVSINFEQLHKEAVKLLVMQKMYARRDQVQSAEGDLQNTVDRTQSSF